MTQQTRKMALGAFLYPTGHHAAAWRHPEAQADAGINFKHYAAVAQAAEAAKFDLLFLADSAGARGKDWSALARFRPITWPISSRSTLLGALAAMTERIGLVATASTTYNEPYHLARKFASHRPYQRRPRRLEPRHLAGRGRGGNFGRDQHSSTAIRYDRAAEFLEVVIGLWDSWEDDAFLRDKASGVFFDWTRCYILDHKGGTSACAGRSTSRARRRDIPSWSRPDRPTPAEPWPPHRPTSCSPPSRRWTARRSSTGTSRRGPWPTAAHRKTS